MRLTTMMSCHSADTTENKKGGTALLLPSFLIARRIIITESPQKMLQNQQGPQKPCEWLWKQM